MQNFKSSQKYIVNVFFSCALKTFFFSEHLSHCIYRKKHTRRRHMKFWIFLMHEFENKDIKTIEIVNTCLLTVYLAKVFFVRAKYTAYIDVLRLHV